MFTAEKPAQKKRLIPNEPETSLKKPETPKRTDSPTKKLDNTDTRIHFELPPAEIFPVDVPFYRELRNALERTAVQEAPALFFVD